MLATEGSKVMPACGAQHKEAILNCFNKHIQIFSLWSFNSEYGGQDCCKQCASVESV